MDHQHEPLIRKVDCVQIQVPDLDAGLAFYRDQLGHQLVWRTERAVGLRLPDTDAEIVLQIERPGIEINLMVAFCRRGCGAHCRCWGHRSRAAV